MRVFVDPTELRPGSRLPPAVAAVAEPLPQLEARTGADLLLSRLPIPIGSDELLRRHCQEGLLAQLKRWSDLQNAITTEQRLFREIFEMRNWTPRPWLVVSGLLFPHQDKAVVGKIEQVSPISNGMVRMNAIGREGLAYAAVDAALDAFAYYGGYIKFLPDNDLLLPWLERQAKALDDIAAGKVVHLRPRGPQRTLEGPTQITWLAALFDGIGEKTAAAVFERLKELHIPDPTLYDAISFVTSFVATEIPGITEERVRSWRALLGLDRFGLPQDKGLPATYATMGLTYRLVETGEIYWRGPYGAREHYRNGGWVETEKVFTPPMLRDLLGTPWKVIYREPRHSVQSVSGVLRRVELDEQFEWLVIETASDTVRVRLDWIEDMEMERSTKNVATE